MTLATITVFAVALMVNSGSPGPSIAALVSRVLQSGWRSVIPFLAAMWIGEVLWMTAAVFGLAALAVTFHYAFVVLKYLGIAYLLYLAWDMWHAPTKPTGEPLPGSENPVAMFSAGMAITLGNPKIMVFYLALLPGLIDLPAITIADWLVLGVITSAVLAAIDLTWVAGASIARNLLRSPSAVRLTNKISAGMMTGAAGFLAFRN